MGITVGALVAVFTSAFVVLVVVFLIARRRR